MGWSAYIRSKTPIAIEDVDKAIKPLDPPWYGLASRQSWGWSYACDVFLPEGNELRVGGAHFSFGQSKSFTRALAHELEKLGYEISEVTEPKG